MQRGRNHLPGKSPWKTTPSPLRKPVGEPYSGTDPKRLWLLRSRPDQVHRRTMRRGPPSKILAELRVARSASLLLGGPRGAVCAPPSPALPPRGRGRRRCFACLGGSLRFAWLCLGLPCLYFAWLASLCLALPWLAFTSLGSLRFAWLCLGLPCLYFAWLASLCLALPGSALACLAFTSLGLLRFACLACFGLPWLDSGAATGLSRRGRGGSRGRRGLCGRPGR
ncbi:hypothetical protein LMG26842_01582 [Achromobacter dolens]|nr:hypothetical protein LMG26842_01582 [Achromobacter dolens]